MIITRTMTAEHLEPWNGNIVDMTMLDGTHQTGLLQRIDADWVRLKPLDGTKVRADTGLVRISDAISIARAARN